MLKSGKLTTDILLTAHVSPSTTTPKNSKSTNTTSLKRKHNKISPQQTRAMNTNNKRAKKEDNSEHNSSSSSSSSLSSNEHEQNSNNTNEQEIEENENTNNSSEDEELKNIKNKNVRSEEGQEPNSENSQPEQQQSHKPKIRLVAQKQTQPQTTPPLNKALLKKVIALEGQIGVGKSTLSQKMIKKYGDLCGVYEEQTNEGFLKLFYGNPSKYGFAFQWGMLKTRIYQLKLAQHDQLTTTKPPNKFFVWDRSMIGDYIFALWYVFKKHDCC